MTDESLHGTDVFLEIHLCLDCSQAPLIAGVVVFFEGSEKKFEIVLKEGQTSLRQRPKSYWQELVQCSRAEIIGEVANDHVTAYLLSESSLFVWDNRITMITCGETTLANAVEFFLKDQGDDAIDMLVFQRKNEFQSYRQKSNFFEDVERLEKLTSGESLCFGTLHEHHNLLYASKHPYTPEADDCTLELLMYDIDSSQLDILTDENTCLDKTRKALQLSKIFSDYDINDFCFKPFGYSLNAIRGETYATIHVTPQRDTSYISFETNAPRAQVPGLLNHFLEVLKPGTFDLITFNFGGEKNISNDYNLRHSSEKKLSNGYDVAFSHYFHQKTIKAQAVDLDIELLKKN